MRSSGAVQGYLLLLLVSARRLRGGDLIRFFWLDLGLVGKRLAAHSGDLIRAARCQRLIGGACSPPERFACTTMMNMTARW
ncbi:hypothetical protein EF096_10445 [Pseudomonas neustonica]|uniref:Secreted protein n=1 Tax=Pseudomonas neustonica TaxID=2487346 RepID=A0ABX9XHV4_9PSED|nr:hypothetical protein EF099_07540 [Pseudomonas sp. SSM44]ROZ84409.1 hypothetical protein EF096_10445 [Pseudomonas neustonica]